MNKNYYIKEHNNPQLGTFYILEGLLSAAMAKRKSRTLYGTNTLHAFPTKKSYLARAKELQDAGEKVW